MFTRLVTDEEMDKRTGR